MCDDEYISLYFRFIILSSKGLLKFVQRTPSPRQHSYHTHTHTHPMVFDPIGSFGNCINMLLVTPRSLINLQISLSPSLWLFPNYLSYLFISLISKH